MTLSVIVQAFGWVAVVWLIAVHLLIHQGRLHRGGNAPRIAGAAAALVIVLASLLAEMWPVFVLGLLWLRSELWHRHSPDEAWFPLPEEHPRPAGEHPDPDPDRPAARQSESHSESHSEPHLDLHPLSGPSGGTATRARVSSARTNIRTGTRTNTGPVGRPAGPQAHHPDPHRRPVISKRTVDVLFRIEMTLLIAVTVAAFGFWAYQERPGFNQRADYSVCHLMMSAC